MRFKRAMARRWEQRCWDLPVDVGRVRLRNPVIASSGTYGYGLEYARYGDPRCLGAVIVKSLSVDPRPGFAAPRVTMLDEPGSMLNAVGVPNPGVDRWARDILPTMLQRGVPVVASVWGEDVDEVVGAAELLSCHRGPIAWEVNLSCPNSERGGAPVSHDPEASAMVCRAIRALAPDEVGIWAKISPDVPDVVAVAVACHGAGADAITVSNTYPAGSMAQAAGHRVAGGAGGMSGAVLRPYVEALIRRCGEECPNVVVLACGGVLSSQIALDYLDMGATAVEVGTANLYDPRACHRIAFGVVDRLRSRA